MGRLGLLGLLALMACAAVPARALIAPWYIQANKIVAVMSGDSTVLSNVTTVEGAGGQSEVHLNLVLVPYPCPMGPGGQTVDNCGDEEGKAQALATMLAPFGNFTPASGDQLKTFVVYKNAVVAAEPFPTNATIAYQNMLKILQSTNRYFVEGLPPKGVGVPSNYNVVFQPLVLQYPTGDLSNPYGIATKVAADLFAEVFSFANATGLLAASAQCPEGGCYMPVPAQVNTTLV